MLNFLVPPTLLSSPDQASGTRRRMELHHAVVRFRTRAGSRLSLASLRRESTPADNPVKPRL